jgi:hypothetical protein
MITLKDGILVTFDVVGERFKVWITNPDTIKQVKDLRAGKSNANIPNGRVHRGSGEDNHNAPYSWHLDPQEIAMAEVAIEVCDARPSYVEAHIDEFVDTITRFCPWNTKLVNIEDLRENLEGVAKL